MRKEGLVITALIAYLLLSSSKARAKDWREYVEVVARKEGIDPDLVRAIILTESGGNPYAYRKEIGKPYESIGLMQVTLQAARDVGFRGRKEDLFDPFTNIEVGVKYLKKMINRFGLYYGIAAYNAGPGNVLRGRYSKRYVMTVLRHYDRIKRGLESL